MKSQKPAKEVPKDYQDSVAILTSPGGLVQRGSYVKKKNG